MLCSQKNPLDTPAVDSISRVVGRRFDLVRGFLSRLHITCWACVFVLSSPTNRELCSPFPPLLVPNTVQSNLPRPLHNCENHSRWLKSTINAIVSAYIQPKYSEPLVHVSRLFPARPCVYYQTDTCPFSAEECDYSHVMATPEQLATMKAPQDTLRTKPCRFFVAGNCKDAVWCRFKHPAYIPATSFCEPKRVDDDAQKVNVPEVERASGLDGCLSAHSEQPTYEDIPDIRDVDKKWKTRLEHHPKYRSAFFSLLFTYNLPLSSPFIFFFISRLFFASSD